ncbi:hypothetical protein G9U51_13165 [Calidifontibacter sp. DB0510]|uniref:Uncharacterized protein n=1 Tax=Metallococcus carri TaxID=1656884 RepID=A0A967B0V3_9MICO|nr:hypothetical protein [Metallococcus carri]NHN56729.1 hypothetical protein [Metallococcus carri]NOP37894.1 hypothetical protein [Calidifontibacter sp. DB2511S]
MRRALSHRERESIAALLRSGMPIACCSISTPAFARLVLVGVAAGDPVVLDSRSPSPAPPNARLRDTMFGEIAAAGEAAGIPLRRGGSGRDRGLLVGDALVLAEEIRVGGAVDAVLEVSGLPTVPSWLEEMAWGGSTQVTLGLRSAHRLEVIATLIGTRGGWGQLVVEDGALRFEGLGRAQLQAACAQLERAVARTDRDERSA